MVENTYEKSEILSKKFDSTRTQTDPDGNCTWGLIIWWTQKLPMFISFNLSPCLCFYDNYKSVNQCFSNDTHVAVIPAKCENAYFNVFIHTTCYFVGVWLFFAHIVISNVLIQVQAKRIWYWLLLERPHGGHLGFWRPSWIFMAIMDFSSLKGPSIIEKLI